MSSTRYTAPTPTAPTKLLSSKSLTISSVHTLLQSHLDAISNNVSLFTSADPGTTASLKRIEMSMRGIYGPAAESQDEEDGIGTGELCSMEIDGEEYERGEEDDYAPTELADVPGQENEEEVIGDVWTGEVVVDKEARKKAKKERMKLAKQAQAMAREADEPSVIS